MSSSRNHHAARLALAALILGLAPAAWSAQTVHLTVTAAGTTLLCESTIVSLGRENTLEATSLGLNVFRPLDPATGVPARNAVHRPLRITKRFDRCSPLLMKALVNGEPITATARFYRPSVSGAGAEEHFYTIAIGRANIVGISSLSPDTLNSQTATLAAFETVSFTYGEITWTDEINGNTFGPVNP